MQQSISYQSPSSAAMALREAVAARIPARQKLAMRLLAVHAKDSLHDLKVENVIMGMRGAPCVLWEISQVDNTGVRYHGKPMQELEAMLPKWRDSTQFSPEAVIWFLFTAQVPTPAQLEGFTADLVSRSELSKDLKAYCDSLPSDIPASTQLIMCMAYQSKRSKLIAALDGTSGLTKNEMWIPALEDALDMISSTPMVAARIYCNTKRDGAGRDEPLDYRQDLAHNFAARLGKSDPGFVELIRLYWALHMDHGANVSAHVMRLCSSAWTDVYSTGAAGLIGGTGALHAKAIVNAVEYNRRMSDQLGADPSDSAISAYIRNTLEKKLILPGYGHAVLIGKDPRYEFIARYVATLPEEKRADPRCALLNLVARASTIAPPLLRELVPKMRNPAPNVDALSGCLMYAHGMEPDFLLPIMAVSRGMGYMAQYTWDRALLLPIERPSSITMDEIVARLAPPTWAAERIGMLKLAYHQRISTVHSMQSSLRRIYKPIWVAIQSVVVLMMALLFLHNTAL